MQTAAMQPTSYSRSVRHNLRASTTDGVLWSVNQGLGASYLIAFFLAVGIGEVASGLLATVPLLAGAVLQLGGPLAVRLFGSYRRWCMACGLLQAAMYIPLLWAALHGHISATAAFVISAVFTGAGLACGTAWQTYMGYLVPRSVRPGYFAARNRAIQVGMLSGILITGVLLETLGAIREYELLIFAGVFWVASILRVISVIYLGRQSETPDVVRSLNLVGPRELFARLLRGPDGKLLTYMLVVQVANFMAVAFLAAYLLKRLELSYGWYMTLMAVPFVVKTVTIPLVGKLAKRYGAYLVLRFAGLAIVPLAAMWGLADHYLYLILVQTLAGMAWGAYELVTFLLFFETIREEERTSVLTSFNLANAMAIVGGSLLGGWLITTLGGTAEAYVTVFCLSSCVLLLTLGLLARVVQHEFHPVPMVIRTRVMRLFSGSIDEPLLPSIGRSEHSNEPVVESQRQVDHRDAEVAEVGR